MGEVPQRPMFIRSSGEGEGLVGLSFGDSAVVDDDDDDDDDAGCNG